MKTENEVTDNNEKTTAEKILDSFFADMSPTGTDLHGPGITTNTDGGNTDAASEFLNTFFKAFQDEWAPYGSNVTEPASLLQPKETAKTPFEAFKTSHPLNPHATALREGNRESTWTKDTKSLTTLFMSVSLALEVISHETEPLSKKIPLRRTAGAIQQHVGIMGFMTSLNDFSKDKDLKEALNALANALLIGEGVARQVQAHKPHMPGAAGFGGGADIIKTWLSPYLEAALGHGMAAAANIAETFHGDHQLTHEHLKAAANGQQKSKTLTGALTALSQNFPKDTLLRLQLGAACLLMGHALHQEAMRQERHKNEEVKTPAPPVWLPFTGKTHGMALAVEHVRDLKKIEAAHNLQKTGYALLANPQVRGILNHPQVRVAHPFLNVENEQKKVFKISTHQQQAELRDIKMELKSQLGDSCPSNVNMNMVARDIYEVMADTAGGKSPLKDLRESGEEKQGLLEQIQAKVEHRHREFWTRCGKTLKEALQAVTQKEPNKKDLGQDDMQKTKQRSSSR